MKCCFGVSHSHCDPCCLNTIPPVAPSPVCNSFTEPQRAFQPFTSPGDPHRPPTPLPTPLRLSSPSPTHPVTRSLFLSCLASSVSISLNDSEWSSTQLGSEDQASTVEQSSLNRTVKERKELKDCEENKHMTQTMTF